MLIRTPGPHDPRSSEVTPRAAYLNRRAFMTGAAAIVAGVAGCEAPTEAALKPAVKGAALPAPRNQGVSVTDPPTPWDSATTYNNFYEFGTDKADPALHSHTLRPRPWSVEVGGLCQKPKTFDIEELLRLAPLEERVYALRCVEGWSMVIPWIGYPLAALLKRVEPTGSAKYVEFQTLVDPEQMPGQKPSFFGSSLDWPYVGGAPARRGAPPAHPADRRDVRARPPERERRAHPNRGALEVRVQERQVAGADPSRRRRAEDELEQGRAERVRVLLEREPDRGPSAVEPGDRAAHRRVPPPEDAHVQRVRRPGRVPLHRDGLEEAVLGAREAGRGPDRGRAPSGAGDEYVEKVLAAQAKHWGAPLLNHLVYARRPSIFRGVRGMWAGLDASGLIDGRLEALVNRRVAALNGCEF